MQPQIDNILDLLKDGKWHTIKEISDRTSLHQFKIETFTEFLADYSLLEFNKKEGKARLSKVFADFLKKVHV